jgi:hypothetical protein
MKTVDKKWEQDRTGRPTNQGVEEAERINVSEGIGPETAHDFQIFQPHKKNSAI